MIGFVFKRESSQKPKWIKHFNF